MTFHNMSLDNDKQSCSICVRGKPWCRASFSEWSFNCFRIFFLEMALTLLCWVLPFYCLAIFMPSCDPNSPDLCSIHCKEQNSYSNDSYHLNSTGISSYPCRYLNIYQLPNTNVSILCHGGESCNLLSLSMYMIAAHW